MSVLGALENSAGEAVAPDALSGAAKGPSRKGNLGRLEKCVPTERFWRGLSDCAQVCWGMFGSESNDLRCSR